MTNLAEPAAAAPATDAAASHPQPSAAASPTGLSAADALEIAQICTLANRANQIASFLEAGAKPADVRSQLLAALASGSPEISSHIAPDAARPPASNPLIDAAKQLAAQSAKKEI